VKKRQEEESLKRDIEERRLEQQFQELQRQREEEEQKRPQKRATITSTVIAARRLGGRADISSGMEDFFFELPPEKEDELHRFFSSIGLPTLAERFVEHAIDLDTMLGWKHPQRHLRRIGIVQEGVIQRVSWAIRDECEERGIIDRPPVYESTMFGTSSAGLSSLGTIIAEQAEQLLTLAKSTNVANNAKATALSSTVMLDDGSEFTFTFAVEPDDDGEF